MHIASLRQKGHINVNRDKQAEPVNLYYELHGDGPEKVVMVMGNVNIVHGSSSPYSKNIYMCPYRSKYPLQRLGFPG